MITSQTDDHFNNEALETRGLRFNELSKATHIKKVLKKSGWNVRKHKKSKQKKRKDFKDN